MRGCYRFSAVIFLLSLLPGYAFGQLRINEVSQGASGTKEYIELVVVGNRTCTDSCADIRGWIIDDNSGWLGAGSGQGIATGCMRFSTDNNWSCVPYGSIILLYNDADMNGSITQAPDPTDSNNDNVYILPASSPLLERHPSLPISPSSLSFVYPATGYVAGGSWSTMGLANTGDGVVVTSPANLGQAYHSFGFGSISGGNNASVYIATSGGGRVYYLSDDQYNNAGNWVAGTVPGGETPGMPNTTANASWINGMLTQVGGTVSSDIYTCISQGNTYFFNNQNITTAGVYQDTLVSSGGCDSIVTLYLQVVTPNVQHQYEYGCGQVVYQGNTYTASVNLYDTTQGVLGCDSLVNVTHIVVQHITPTVVNSNISGCGAVTYNSVTYTSSAQVNDTIYSIAGCDSIYAQLAITIYPQNPVAAYDTLTGCGSVTWNGQTYYTNTILTDTLSTQYGCDSVYYNRVLQIVAPPGLLTVTPGDTTICPGNSVRLVATGGNNIQWLELTQLDSITIQPAKTRTYIAVGEAQNGCNDTATARVAVEDFELTLSSNEPELVQGQTLYLITSGNYAYAVDGWLPAGLFTDQQAKVQQRLADVKRTYTVYGHSLEAGCKDTSQVTVNVQTEQTIFLPNAFTPNGDGMNDYIFPLSNKKFRMLTFMIYNRWGNLVYNWEDGDRRGWDGTYKGAQVDQGVFVYYIQVALDNNELWEKKGNITLLK